jgi:hypothetical protein
VTLPTITFDPEFVSLRQEGALEVLGRDRTVGSPPRLCYMEAAKRR